MIDLFGPRERVKRAKSEIIALQDGFQGFFKDNVYRIRVAEYNRKADNYSLRVQSGPPDFPVDWSLLIGEIVHNLRAALDGLIYQLIRDNGKSPSYTSQFPIFLIGHTSVHRGGRRKNALIAHFWGQNLSDGLSMITGLNKRHWATIEGFQPYKRGNGNHHSSLYLLKELNNTDKHRLITVLEPGAANWTFQGMAGSTHFNRRMKLYMNAKIGWVTEPPPNNPGPDRGGIYTLDLSGWTGPGLKGAILVEPKMQVDVRVGPYVRFGDSCKPVKGLPVIRTLQGMSNQVSRVIEAFT